MDLHSLSSPKSPACFAHLVSHLSSFHPCKVNKGCEAGVKAGEGESLHVRFYSPQGGAHEPSSTFARVSGRHGLAGTEISAHKQPPPANSNNGERQVITELQCSVIRAALRGKSRYGCEDSGVDTEGRELLKDLKSKASA